MELAISIISLITAIIALLSSILPTTLNMRRDVIEFNNKYNQMRSDIAAALTMYACYYHNPLDLAKQPDHKLPPSYETASVQLRTLGATASALAAIIPEKSKKIQTNKSDLREISGYLIGLSNSMHTPYDCGASIEDLRAVREWETEIKRLLKNN